MPEMLGSQHARHWLQHAALGSGGHASYSFMFGGMVNRTGWLHEEKAAANSLRAASVQAVCRFQARTRLRPRWAHPTSHLAHQVRHGYRCCCRQGSRHNARPKPMTLPHVLWLPQKQSIISQQEQAFPFWTGHQELVFAPMQLSASASYSGAGVAAASPGHFR